MIVTGHQIAVWAVGVLGTTVGNLITLAVCTAITSTQWFKLFLVKLTEDFNNLIQARAKERSNGK